MIWQQDYSGNDKFNDRAVIKFDPESSKTFARHYHRPVDTSDDNFVKAVLKKT